MEKIGKVWKSHEVTEDPRIIDIWHIYYYYIYILIYTHIRDDLDLLTMAHRFSTHVVWEPGRFPWKSPHCIPSSMSFHVTFWTKCHFGRCCQCQHPKARMCHAHPFACLCGHASVQVLPTPGRDEANTIVQGHLAILAASIGSETSNGP